MCVFCLFNFKIAKQNNHNPIFLQIIKKALLPTYFNKILVTNYIFYFINIFYIEFGENMKNQKIDQCVVLMAGKGTRFLPATRAVAKELFPIGNKPVLLFHLLEAMNSGIKRVCFVISKEKESVKNFLKHDKNLEKQLEKSGRIQLLNELNSVIDNLEIDFIYQGKMNGSGGAVYSAKDWTQGKPFVIVNGDDLCLTEGNKPPVMKQLIDAYEKTGKNIIGAKEFPMEVISRYSSIIKKEKLLPHCFKMDGIIEKPTNPPSNLVGLARYVVTKDIFDEILKCTPKNDEIYLTDALDNLARAGLAACYEFEAKYYDCGNKLEFIKCMIDFGLHEKDIFEDLKKYIIEISKNFN